MTTETIMTTHSEKPEIPSASVVSIDRFLKPKRIVRIDLLEYHDESFAMQIHQEDTKEGRKLMAQRMRVFADHLEDGI